MFKIHKFDVVDSTNNVARDYGFGSVIVAEEQISGKGRFDRKWDSPKGGLWFSIVLKPSRSTFEYTFIASLAVLKSIGMGKVKWPNDIVYNGKKICGILSEIISQGNEEKVIIGIGINVNNSIPASLKDVAVSLKEITGKEVDLNLLVNKIILKLQELNKIEFKEILNEYKKNCSVLGKEVKVKSVDGVIRGKAVDISYDGELVVEKDGKRIEVSEGDVSFI